MDWSLRTCGRKGHITYAPTEPQLRERLHADTPVGEVWRCLRCGDFVLGDPAGSGPAGDAPTVLRGRALRDAFVLRLLAAERFLRAIVIGAAAYAVLRYSHSEDSLRQLFDKDLPAAKPLAKVFGYNLDSSSIVAHIQKLLNVKKSTLHVVSLLLTGYAVIELLESIGLWMLKRWGEYFSAVATAVFLPYEIYELVEKFSVLKIVTFAINLAAVLYLLLTKRLFGLRGGRAAYDAKRSEQSLLEVQDAATDPGDADRGDAGPDEAVDSWPARHSRPT
jgi:uncharacterized membrane protein (DUF2068 family)